MRCEAGHCLPEGRADGKRCLASETPRAWRVGEKIKVVTAGYKCSVFSVVSFEPVRRGGTVQSKTSRRKHS